jgi:hypothetical protein
MAESNRWELRRYVTLLVVLSLHMALLAALVMSSRTRDLAASISQPIELLFIPPAKSPKIRSENSHPEHLRAATALSIAPPALDSPMFSSSQSPTFGSKGNGSDVDWRAEARRALQAFEIRSHQPQAEYSISSAPQVDDWWSQAPHRTGDQFKTANGDWIVWINSSCYQVASSASAGAVGAMAPQTICPHKTSTPQNDPRRGH